MVLCPVMQCQLFLLCLVEYILSSLFGVHNMFIPHVCMYVTTTLVYTCLASTIHSYMYVHVVYHQPSLNLTMYSCTMSCKQNS